MEKETMLQIGKNKEEKYFLSQVLDKVQETKKTRKGTVSSFFDEYQKSLAKKVMEKQQDVLFAFWGGYEEAERTILICYPENWDEVMQEKWKRKEAPLQVIRITLPKMLQGSYQHRQYLGAVMKLGIEREMVGDILVREQGADIIVKKEMANYLMNHLSMLTRFQKADVTLVPIEEIKQVEKKVKEFTIIVSSMRADAIVAELLHTSRQKAVDVIKEERVFVNFEKIEKITKELKIGDKITVRGKGRFYLKEQLRTSKSGKIILSVEKNI